MIKILIFTLINLISSATVFPESLLREACESNNLNMTKRTSSLIKLALQSPEYRPCNGSRGATNRRVSQINRTQTIAAQKNGSQNRTHQKKLRILDRMNRNSKNSLFITYFKSQSYDYHLKNVFQKTKNLQKTIDLSVILRIAIHLIQNFKSFLLRSILRSIFWGCNRLRAIDLTYTAIRRTSDENTNNIFSS